MLPTWDSGVRRLGISGMVYSFAVVFVVYRGQSDVSTQDRCLYEFGAFRVDTHRRVLTRRGAVVPLPGKSFELLAILVQNFQRVVTKEDLMNRLWPEAVVEECNLTQHVSLLRKVLGERAFEHRYILTLPSQGYRFVANVREVTDPDIELEFPPVPSVSAEEPSDARSIAVIPFRCLDPEAGAEYLGLGIADALTTKLTTIRQLKVRSIYAAMESRPCDDPVILGRNLHVDTLVQGTVRRWGDRVRVTVQIVAANDGTLLLGDTFDEKLVNLFAIEDAISERIGQALMLKLADSESRRPSRSHTQNTEAYQAYLKGRYFCNKRMPEALRKAVEYFELACQQDIGYSLAHFGLANCWHLLACYSVEPASEVWTRVRKSLVRALEIDSQLAEAESLLAMMRMASEWDWRGAEQACRRALSHKPESPMAHNDYATYLTAVAQHDEAIAESGRALELEPLSPTINRDAGLFLYMARRYSEAIVQLRHTLGMDESFAPARWALGWCLEAMGQHDEAIEELKAALALFGENARVLADLGHAYACAGMRQESEAVLERLTSMTRQHNVSPYDLATVWAGLGETDRAFTCLESACEERPWAMVYLKVEPKLDTLRTDLRFRYLLQRVGIP